MCMCAVSGAAAAPCVCFLFPTPLPPASLALSPDAVTLCACGRLGGGVGEEEEMMGGKVEGSARRQAKSERKWRCLLLAL